MSTSIVRHDISITKSLERATAATFRAGETITGLRRLAWVHWQKIERQAEWWRARRQLLCADESMLKDIGLPRCSIEWATRYGRDDRVGGP